MLIFILKLDVEKDFYSWIRKRFDLEQILCSIVGVVIAKHSKTLNLKHI